MMRNGLRGQGLAVLALIALGVCLGADSTASTLTADPTAVTFSKMDAEAGIRLFLDGKAVGKPQVEGLFIGVENKSYARMFVMRFSESDAGLLLLRPNPSQAEVGSYDLRIRIAGQEVTVPVFMPLDELPDMLENEAARRGMTVEALREAYSLNTRSGREQIEVKLPERMTEGTYLEIPVGGDAGHFFSWKVKDEAVLEGRGKSTLRIPLNTPGELKVSVEERADKVVVASWSGQTLVVPRAAIEWKIPIKATAALAGPEGYGRYAWRLDGKPLGEEKTLRHRFAKPGTYVLECRAEEPNEPAKSPHAFERLVWNITVTN